MPPRIPQPSHRHGAPSGPWPFLDLDSEIDPDQLANPQHLQLHPTTQQQHWSKYPQSLFPNWTPAQQEERNNEIVARTRERCTIHPVHVWKDGKFTREEDFVVTPDNQEEYWKTLHQEVSSGVRLRALFLDNLSGPVLQILGTKSCRRGKGDHITLTLTFILPSSPTSAYAASIPPPISRPAIISYSRYPGRSHGAVARSQHNHQLPSAAHPPDDGGTYLRTRLLAAGQSVYWNKIFSSTISADPTFVLLALLWYHSTPSMSHSRRCTSTFAGCVDILSAGIPGDGRHGHDLTQQLHVVRAHLLHYASLLETFAKTITYVKDLMRKESAHLLNEIARLEQSRSMQDNRLKNVMNLAFSSTMRKLTEAAVRDSAAMKQISYLTMFFLPASFAASVFGMNLITIWLIMALQYRKKDPNHLIHDDNYVPIWRKLSWP
ncbi:hypothetical protein B0H13DRAFT_2450845 [Mycena leptocephala]|nr:hypothetical protein B0H13DRAFT_2450845 [Mycena leptocephala]